MLNLNVKLNPYMYENKNQQIAGHEKSMATV